MGSSNRPVMRENSQQACRFMLVYFPSCLLGCFGEFGVYQGVEQTKSPVEWLGFLVELGSPTWARTRDLRINSPALYRLSYRGIKGRIIGVECL